MTSPTTPESPSVQSATPPEGAEESDLTSGPAARWFGRFRHRLWMLIPGPLRRHVPITVVGYCVLNLSTFSLDLALLGLLYKVVGLPHPVAITISYVTALSLAYLLNRWFNFRSHGAVGGQSVRYVLAVAINYLAFILGVGSGLTYLGVHFQVARICAGLCEAVWMYCAMRWFVFRPDREPVRD